MNPEPEKARGIEFFEAKPVTPPPPGDPDNPYAGSQMIYKSERDEKLFNSAAPAMLSHEKVAFVMFPEMPLNIIVTEFGPNYVLPVHSHAEDCMYYIERGEILIGQRRLGPGEGFLVRANNRYAYTSGPEGVKVLEIRHQPMNPPNLTLHERDVEKWRERFFAAIGEPVPTP